MTLSLLLGKSDDVLESLEKVIEKKKIKVFAEDLKRVNACKRDNSLKSFD